MINSSSAMEIRSISHRALDGLLDHLFGGLGLRLLVARRGPANDMDEFVDEGDQQNEKAGEITDLRNPNRDRNHALRHLMKAPGIANELARIKGEEADEADADDEADDLRP